MARRTPSPPKSVPGNPPAAPSRPVTPGPDTGRTLLQILQRPNPPTTNHWAGKSHANTRSETDNFDEVLLDDENPSVQEWTDFTFPAIELAYGHLLSQKIRALEANYRDPLTPSPGQRIGDIVNEGSVDAYGIDWSRQIVRAPIRAVGRQLRPVVAPNAGSATEAALFHQRIEWEVPGSKGSKMKPDWAIIDNAVMVRYPQSENPTPKPLTYVVGDSKLSQKWKPEWLPLPYLTRLKMEPSLAMKTVPIRSIGVERVQPLKQVATYCRYAETRYAFILTQRELVALRIRRIPQPASASGDKPFAAIEYAPVPLSADTDLTVNLALWTLACMGMNDEHRKMETAEGGPLEAMARLTWWTFDPDHKVYRNVISKRQIPEAQWKPHYNTFVHLTKDKGQSPTQIFLQVSPALPNVSALAGQMQAMNLGKGSQSSPSTADATKSNHGLTTTSRSKSASPPPSKKSSPQPTQAAATHAVDAASTKPATHPTARSATKPAATESAAKPSTKPAATPAVKSTTNPAANPATNPATKAAVKAAVTPSSGGSRTPATASSSTPPKAKQVFIGNEAFQASYRQSTGKWVVTYKGEELDIVRVGRDSVIVRRDKTQLKVSEAK